MAFSCPAAFSRPRQATGRSDVKRLRMLYLLLVYFNWLAVAITYRLLPRRRRASIGWVCIIAAATVQVLAFTLHWYEWNRLHGRPDAMYAWIVPHLLALSTCVPMLAAFVLAILRGSNRRSPDHRPQLTGDARE